MGEAEFEALLVFKEKALPAAVARKLAELARSGVPVLWVGCKPDRDPGYAEHAERDLAVREAVGSIMGEALGTPPEVVAALIARGVRPQIGFAQAARSLGFIHSIDREDGTPSYFLRNRSRREQSCSVSLPSGGRVPVELDLWNGGAARIVRRSAAEGRIEVTLTFPGYTSRLVSMWTPESAASLPEARADLREEQLHPVAELRDFRLSAELRLSDGGSRAVRLALPEAIDWRDLPELRGLGGPATYETTCTLAGLEPGDRYYLCFDRVCDRADVRVNGGTEATLLVMPWRLDVTAQLRAGQNAFSITVTPTLRNALVAYGKVDTSYRRYRGKPLMPAGLIGAVRLMKTISPV
jgi:hypothetical protein